MSCSSKKQAEGKPVAARDPTPPLRFQESGIKHLAAVANILCCVLQGQANNSSAIHVGADIGNFWVGDEVRSIRADALQVGGKQGDARNPQQNVVLLMRVEPPEQFEAYLHRLTRS